VEVNGVRLRVEGNRIIVTVKGREFYAEYPYDMTGVSEDLLRAMLYVLFIGLIDMPLPTQTSQRKGDKVLLSFSGGADSYALYETIDCIPVYLNRDYQPDYGKHQQGIVDAIGSIRVNNNMELIRTMFGKKHGFNWGCGYASLILPLADKLNARYIALGVVFDDACFHPENGKISYAYTGQLSGESWYKTEHFNKISGCGVDLICPFVGVSEAITTTISKNGKYASLVSSCHFSDKKDCGHCVKCLRKSELVDITLMQKVVDSFVRRPKMAPTMVHSLKKYYKKYKHIKTDLVWDIHKHLIEGWNPDFITKQVISLGYDVVENNEKILKFVKQYNDNSSPSDLEK